MEVAATKEVAPSGLMNFLSTHKLMIGIIVVSLVSVSALAYYTWKYYSSYMLVREGYEELVNQLKGHPPPRRKQQQRQVMMNTADNNMEVAGEDDDLSSASSNNNSESDMNSVDEIISIDETLNRSA